MSTTIHDIAQKAGISVSTVSRVLNNKTTKYRISRETEKIVLKAARELNYRPNQLARGLRLKKTQTIGLVAPDLSNPFFASIVKSIQSAAHKLGYSLVVCDTDENLELEIEHLNLLWSKGVDGLIVMPVGQKYQHLEQLLKEGVSLVLLDRGFDELKASSVLVDNFNGAFEAIEHLIGYGHVRIAIIQGLTNTYTNNGRVQGYKAALAKHGIPIDENLIVGRDFGKENGYIETKLLLKMNDPPTAIFACSDLITLGVLQALFEEGLSIPKDISLVAFDDIDFAPFLICPLTTVAQPKEVMGEIAVKLLAEQMKHQEKVEVKRIVLKPKFLVRNSVYPLTRLQSMVKSAA
ncbi:LacI family transcriptional regulator [candidate division KSB1 bacterium]|nr:LacI family transcriptional regulator [candidate division KSB1 bacterium]